ncbi:hypothetical protein SAMN04489713_104256 [Actinomadura madurae]|uniref:Uncharacterized protein n=1 Tax=Actinomadura madurae TaxID=1993 RepID=A0A1I5ES44_9ACTN|nr:hypothetical protein [Actinomadura madurae]SFO14297.1 hypothetical protein SAMN04489713_104256 [Actinomadura madurae]
MTEPRRALEPERQIVGFDVFELVGGRWRAIHKHDRDLVLEHDRWTELAWSCVGARISAELREAAEELAARMTEPGRQWRPNGPGQGLSV